MARVADGFGSGAGASGFLRRQRAVWGVMFRSDARRPASWVAMAVAAIAAGGAGTAGDAWLPLALAGGALAAAAGSGDPPRGVADVGGRASVSWWIARGVWPLCGSALMAVAGCDGPACAAVAVAVAATTTVMLAAAARGLVAADAVSAGLVPAAAATLVGLVSASWGRTSSVTPALGWLVAAAGVLRLTTTIDSGGAWRRGVQAAAMMTTLTAMAGCFFLATEQSHWYAPLATAWFIAVALPQAALGAGALDEGARARLLRATPMTSLGGASRPGGGEARRAARVAVAWAAILGWPATVAAVLWGGAAAGPDGPLVAVMVLAVLAAAVVVVSGLVHWAGGSTETALAILAAVTVATAAWLATALPSRPAPPAPPPIGESAANRC